MTIKEAIKQLIEIKEYYTPERDFSQYGEDYEPITKEDKEAIDIMINVGEKQIPKKLTIKLSEQMIQGYLYRDKCCYCPMCDSFRGNLDYEPQKIRKYDFCPDCGQALDWGDSNE